jgi:hypothetical protein
MYYVRNIAVLLIRFELGFEETFYLTNIDINNFQCYIDRIGFKELLK